MKIIATNNSANYNFTISNKIEAGIVLTGSEVKSLRINTGSIRGSYILEQNGELWLSNSFIKKYQNSTDNNYDPSRNRKLLVTKKEFESHNSPFCSIIYDPRIDPVFVRKDLTSDPVNTIPASILLDIVKL